MPDSPPAIPDAGGTPVLPGRRTFRETPATWGEEQGA